MNFGDPRLPARFWDKCIPEPNSGCWLWFGALESGGYGCIGIGSRKLKTNKIERAHRLAYMALVGDIPKGLELDHLCRVRCCCNPSHLEPVTRQINVIRGLVPTVSSEYNRVKTHCPKGHPYDGNNLYVRPANSKTPGRDCKACKMEAWHRWYSRKMNNA